MTKVPLIEIKNLTKEYDGDIILKGIDLNCEPDFIDKSHEYEKDYEDKKDDFYCDDEEKKC